MGIFRFPKASIALIDIELIGGLFAARLGIVECAALHEIGVEVAVSIEVGQCCPTTDDFGEQVPAGKSRLMPKSNASRDCFFVEPSDVAPVDGYSWLFGTARHAKY